MKRKLIYSALFLFALSLSGCGQPVGDSSNEVPPSIDTKGFNDIAVDSEIHTEAQKEFLEYEGSYAKMPKDLFPNGQSHLSDSLPESGCHYDLPAEKKIPMVITVMVAPVNRNSGTKICTISTFSKFFRIEAISLMLP